MTGGWRLLQHGMRKRSEELKWNPIAKEQKKKSGPRSIPMVLWKVPLLGAQKAHTDGAAETKSLGMVDLVIGGGFKQRGGWPLAEGHQRNKFVRLS